MRKTTGQKIVLKEHPGLNGDIEYLKLNMAATSLARRIDAAIRRAVLAERKACIQSARGLITQRWIKDDARARDAKARKR